MARTKATAKRNPYGIRKNLAKRIKAINTGSKIVKRKPRRARPGAVALKEIRRYQKTTNLLIPKAPFQRLVRSVTTEVLKLDVRFTASSVDAIHQAAEAHLTSVFEDANLCALHAKRITVMPKDIQLATRLRK